MIRRSGRPRNRIKRRDLLCLIMFLALFIVQQYPSLASTKSATATDLGILITPNATDQSYEIDEISFTPEELDYIKNHPVITVGVDTEFVPFEFVNSEGLYKGIASDYLTLIANATGITFDITTDLSWPKAYDGALKGDLQLLPALTKTEERADYFAFSQPYYAFKRVIVVGENEKEIKGIGDLDDFIVSVQENSSHHSYLSDMNGVSLSLYPSAEIAISAVASGNERVFVGNLATSNYIIRENGLTNLKFIAFNSDDSQTLHFATLKENAALIPIINKVLLAIPDETRLAINSKWVVLNIEPDYTELIKEFIAVGLVVLLLFAVSSFWIIKLKREIHTREEVEKALIVAKKEADEANQVKGNFLARMSHEIRTPLNAINGIAHLLKKTDLNTVQSSYVDRVFKASKTIIDIVNDILDYSKLDADKMTIEQMTFDIDHLVQDIIVITSFPLDRKKLHFRFYKEPSIPNMLIGDQKRIEQILVNLLNNAIKFTEAGEVSLEIKLKVKEDDTYILNFIVSDTGIGMSKEDIAALFTPFQQADSSISRKYGGTGLGLSIVKKLTELMSGKVEVYSTLNKGTCFIVELPFGIDAEQEALYKKERNRYYLSEIETIFFTKRPHQMSFLINSLKNIGISAQIMSDEKTVITKLEERDQKYTKPYDLLIVDFDAYAKKENRCFEALFARENSHTPLKIIALVPYANEAIIKYLEPYSNVVILIQPVVLSILYDAIIGLFYKDNLVYQAPDKPLVQKTAYAIDPLKKVLVVDDNLTNQMIVSEVLKAENIAYITADNGREAVENFEKNINHIGLILMDLHMPVMNGFEASKAIRLISPDIPIIAMTADVIEDTLDRLSSHGIEDYILKPFDPDVLISKIIPKLSISQSTLENLVANEADIHLTSKIEHNDATEASTLKMINLEKAMRHTGLSMDKLTMILKAYRKENADTIALLKTYLEEGDYIKAEQLVHKLKSSTGGIGAEILHKHLIAFQGQLIESDDAIIKDSFEVFKEMMLKLLDEIDHIEN